MMKLFDRLFKKNTEEVLKEESKAVSQQTDRAQGPLPMNAVTQELPKQYAFEFVLTDEQMHAKILDFVRPVTSRWDIINLQIAYGVRESESGLVMVRTKTSQRRDGETGQNFHTTFFAVLTEDEVFEVSYTSENLHDEGALTYEIPAAYAEVLKQAFDFYRNWPAHKEFERACSDATPGFIMNKRADEIRQPLYKELKVYEEQQAKLKEAQRQHMEITCEEDAKRLFFLCDTDCYRKMKEDYDEETIKAFEQYATRENKRFGKARKNVLWYVFIPF